MVQKQLQVNRGIASDLCCASHGRRCIAGMESSSRGVDRMRPQMEYLATGARNSQLPFCIAHFSNSWMLKSPEPQQIPIAMRRHEVLQDVGLVCLCHLACRFGPDHLQGAVVPVDCNSHTAAAFHTANALCTLWHLHLISSPRVLGSTLVR